MKPFVPHEKTHPRDQLTFDEERQLVAGIRCVCGQCRGTASRCPCGRLGDARSSCVACGRPRWCVT